MERAYFVAQGIITLDEEDGYVYDEKLATYLRDIINKGFPVNRIVNYITQKRQEEELPQRFEELLKEMQFSDDEIRTLKSIMFGERPGELHVFYNDKVIATLKREEPVEHEQRYQSLRELMMFFDNLHTLFPEKKFDITFES